MDPLSALSIAASVVQFLDFGAKIIGTSIEIYRSVDGATQESLETEYLVQHARDLNAGLVASQSVNKSRLSNQDELKLLELAARSQAVAQELLDLLVSLRNNGGHRTLAAVKQVIRTKWNEAKIQSLIERLDAIRNETSLQLLCMMSSGQSAISEAVVSIDQRCRNLELQGRLSSMQAQEHAGRTMQLLSSALDKLDSLHGNAQQVEMPQGAEIAGLIQMLHAIRSQTKADVVDYRKTLLERMARAGLDKTQIGQVLAAQSDDYGAVISAAAPLCVKFIADYQLNMNPSLVELDPVPQQLAVLESLVFEEMRQREITIRDAFAKTYAWIFDSVSSPFARWLEGGTGTFWISGKPGSGKSTLMKFMTQHNQTEAMLGKWAAGRNLIQSKHFFWGTGTALQKSYRGLLQGLLFRILCSHPGLVQHACPERWAKASTQSFLQEPWSEHELKNSLELAFGYDERAFAFCIFIDGLDEFAEDHFTLITEIIELHSRRTNVKFCVSSRPYNVFKKAFDKDPTHTFALQDMNAGDIELFIQGKLERDTRFQNLALRDSHAAGICSEIARRADGVFLWVHLVVFDLMRGLSEQDDVAMLQKRLDALPPDLESYFAHILDSVDQVYQRYTARALLLAHRAREPLPIMAYAFLYENDQDEQFLANLTVRPMTREDIIAKRTDIEVKISSWCKGLMEVRQYATTNVWEPLRRYRVDFLHRSVKDYLETSDMQRFLHDKCGAAFEPERMLARLFVAQAKVVNVQGAMSHEMTAFDFMATEARAYASATGSVSLLDPFSDKVEYELRAIKRQLLEQNGTKVPDALKLSPPSHSRSRSRSASGRGLRSSISGFFSSLSAK